MRHIVSKLKRRTKDVSHDRTALISRDVSSIVIILMKRLYLQFIYLPNSNREERSWRTQSVCNLLRLRRHEGYVRLM